MLKLGITGGIGSGKSTVAELFSLLGVPVYLADQRARELIERDVNLVSKIKDLLGAAAYADGIYQRKWVASRVFSDQSLLNKLNNLVHPAVADDFQKWAEAQTDQVPYVVKEAALITARTGLDKVIYVWASEETRISRVKQRDPHRSLEEIRGILAKQPSDTDFKKIADFQIDNENQLLIPQVLEIHRQFIS